VDLQNCCNLPRTHIPSAILLACKLALVGLISAQALLSDASRKSTRYYGNLMTKRSCPFQPPPPAQSRPGRPRILHHAVFNSSNPVWAGAYPRSVHNHSLQPSIYEGGFPRQRKVVASALLQLTIDDL
jgi:hypothetical protein